MTDTSGITASRLELDEVELNTKAETSVSAGVNVPSTTLKAGRHANIYSQAPNKSAVGIQLNSPDNNITFTASNVRMTGYLKDFYKVTTKKITLSSGISAHSYIAASSYSLDAQSGYEPVGIVGWASTNYRIRPTTHYTYINNGNYLYAGFCNDCDSNVTASVDVTFYILWLKATAA